MNWPEKVTIKEVGRVMGCKMKRSLYLRKAKWIGSISSLILDYLI